MNLHYSLWTISSIYRFHSNKFQNLDMRNSWYKKPSFIFGHKPPFTLLFLCLISAVTIISIYGSFSSSSIDFVNPKPVLNIYTKYRRLKEQTKTDYLDLTTNFLRVSRQTEIKFCGKERENYVPCYNVSANLIAGFTDGNEFDRHCKVLSEIKHCLIRPPKDYKVPLRWPASRDVIWSNNVKITKVQLLSSGSMTKRLMLLEENQIAFRSDDVLIVDGVKDYSCQIAEMIGLESDVEFYQAGVRSVLDIGCGFGSFVAHLVSLNLMAVCIAKYELTGSQVQVALEKGLPAIIGNFISRQFPFPSLSFDMVHCAQCGIVWDEKDWAFVIEVDRVLKPGGYFVLTSPTGSSLNTKKGSFLASFEEFTQKICWILHAQEDETFIWQKTTDGHCYEYRMEGAVPLCNYGHESQSYYQPLGSCIFGSTNKRWIPIHNKSSGSQLSPDELELHGIHPEDFYEDFMFWKSELGNYWSLLTPLIFSDHPKRPGDEDPSPPFNMIRNVMDMNSHYGGLNSAFLEAKKLVWVMNVVPVSSRNTLPLIFDRGFSGVLHDWCEPFPTYPRTYDMLHANGLFSLLAREKCSLIDLFFEMDRILRPEGWVVLSDEVGAIEKARMVALRLFWEARVIDLDNGNDQRLLVCQKPFKKK